MKPVFIIEIKSSVLWFITLDNSQICELSRVINHKTENFISTTAEFADMTQMCPWFWLAKRWNTSLVKCSITLSLPFIAHYGCRNNERFTVKFAIIFHLKIICHVRIGLTPDQTTVCTQNFTMVWGYKPYINSRHKSLSAHPPHFHWPMFCTTVTSLHSLIFSFKYFSSYVLRISEPVSC